MKTLYDWAKEIALAAIIAEMLYMIVPEGKMKKFIGFSIRMTVTLWILEPILELVFSYI